MPTLVIEILDGIAIDGFLPDAPQGGQYHAALRGYGTVAPEQWAVIDGALPPGWALDHDTGEIVGPLDTPGTYSIIVELRDVQDHYVTRSFTWRVVPVPPPGLNLTEPWEVPAGNAANFNLTEDW